MDIEDIQRKQQELVDELIHKKFVWPGGLEKPDWEERIEYYKLIRRESSPIDYEARGTFWAGPVSNHRLNPLSQKFYGKLEAFISRRDNTIVVAGYEVSPTPWRHHD